MRFLWELLLSGKKATASQGHESVGVCLDLAIRKRVKSLGSSNFCISCKRYTLNIGNIYKFSFFFVT